MGVVLLFCERRNSSEIRTGVLEISIQVETKCGEHFEQRDKTRRMRLRFDNAVPILIIHHC